ncbi:MAG: V-type ATP synthase subunit F [Lachnospiraceae bacterium]
MYKVAVLGNYDSIYGFAALGLDTFPITDPADAEEKITQLAGNKYAVIYITEELAELMGHAIEKYREQVIPAIIQIPGISGNTGAGVNGIKKSVEQAVGSDILFSGN